MPDAPLTGRRGVPGTKLAVPELPPQLVPRPRLVAMLDRARDSMVTLVNAPAGAGKTLLLAGWVRANGANTAWVSLDADDNEDRRFWSALLDALSAAGATSHPLPGLPVPASPSTDPAFLADVVDALDDLPAPVLLVLDDVHELTDPRPLHGLETLLQHQPAGLRVVLSTRRVTRLPLTRVRLADELAEIRAEDLRFTQEEARALVDRAGLRLTPDQLGLLLDRTEGWAAGLRLATLSTDTGSGPGIDFATNDRAVADYLVDEVLFRLPGDMCDFLSTISVCEQVSADLAAELSGRADAASLLDAIAERTSLVRLETAHWYHVHKLLRTHLRGELVRHAPDRAAHLHARAATWFAARDRPATALTHAAAAGDVAQATALMHRHALPLALRGEHDLVRGVLGMLGTRLVAEDSRLALVSALLHLEQGEPRLADRDLGHAEVAWPPAPAEDLVSLRLLVRSVQALNTGDAEDFVRATEHLDVTPGHHLDAAAMLQRGTALLVAGHRQTAGEQLRAGLAAARAAGHGYLATQCLTMLAAHAAVDGDLAATTTLATAADRENTRRGWRPPLPASAILAYGALLHADPAECVRQAGRAMPPGRSDATPGVRLVVDTIRGAAEFELGERVAGARRIHDARAAGTVRFSAEQVALCAVMEHRTALLLGWGPAAAEALRWSLDRIPDSAEVRLMRARAQFAQGRRDAAAKTIQPALTGDAAPVLPWSVIDAWLLACNIALTTGDEAGAHRALRRALALAQQLDVPYPVVFAAADVVNLLTGQLGRLGPAERFADHVFTLRRGLDVTPMTPLTASECAVLRLLPTLRSLEEIGEDLTVSANTVKTHVRAIYAKLGVTHRRDAIAVALGQGLLENGPEVTRSGRGPDRVTRES